MREYRVTADVLGSGGLAGTVPFMVNVPRHGRPSKEAIEEAWHRRHGGNGLWTLLRIHNWEAR